MSSAEAPRVLCCTSKLAKLMERRVAEGVARAAGQTGVEFVAAGVPEDGAGGGEEAGEVVGGAW